ncbi:hypothetical protein GYMLUDRAFT_236888 [Collybiopsis luxurians FD-317 M1]|nr:hypothetical protein GYMLUDRAFT_236888 [Collybiopsis luxurians FD-317 M1]
MDAQNCQKLCNIISYLGGPSYSPDELEWATRIPAGKNLIGWLADQLPSDGDIAFQRAALSRIALHVEEVKLLRQSENNHPKSDKVNVSAYIPPNRQSSRNTLVDNSSYTLEQEIELLQHRLKQTKILSQHLQKTAQTVKAESERVEGKIDEKQQDLEQLSLQADSVVPVTESLRVLQCLQENLDLTFSTTLLTNCLRARTQITQNVTQQLESIDLWASQLPNVEELESEALRFQRILGLHETSASSISSEAEESAYLDYLRQLMASLEAVKGNDGEIYDLLQQLGSETDRSSRKPLDIGNELELAWNLDQSTILEARASVLEQAASQFQQIILPSLQSLHTFVTNQQSLLRETLVILGAFSEEMNEITHELTTLKGLADLSTELSAKLDNFSGLSTLESRLKTLLKDMQNLRPADLSPLVLLDEEDVLSELKALKQKEKSLNALEEEQCESLPMALNMLMASHEPSLHATYAHSAVRTSKPYELSPSVSILQHDAKVKSASLTAGVQRLQADLKILDDSRTQRKLKSFVERWNSLSSE